MGKLMNEDEDTTSNTSSVTFQMMVDRFGQKNADAILVTLESMRGITCTNDSFDKESRWLRVMTEHEASTLH
jgi:hypothetical protein